MITIVLAILGLITLACFLHNKLLIKFLGLQFLAWLLVLLGALLSSGWLFLGLAIIFRLMQIGGHK